LHAADEHFARVQRWGFNAVRLLITWEAIAHAGPGQDDAAYLSYLTIIVARLDVPGAYSSLFKFPFHA
jgi:aryl-phospho-beta-D-glucosidase BglC (GH1 family)